MNKQVYKAVSDRAGGLCELCMQYKPLQLHHIIGGVGKRKQHETVESCIMLCLDCHDEVEGNYRLDRALKKMVQAIYAGQGYGETEIRRMMGGKLY